MSPLGMKYTFGAALLMMLQVEPADSVCFGPEVKSVASLSELEALCGKVKNTSIPETIGNLGALEYADLSFFENVSSMPESFSLLTHLTFLKLENIGLESLPSSFRNLSDLVFLDLSENKLQSLPGSFGQLTNLAMLYLGGNRIETLPESFNHLTNLEHLVLESNRLHSVPETFGQLTNLVHLSLAGNLLKSMPNSTGQLKELKVLKLENNRLQSLPESFPKLTLLQELNLSTNRLEAIPDGFVQLTNLIQLDLSGNLLKSLPSELGKMESFKTLTLGNNHFTCDRSSLGWFENVDPRKVTNIDDVQCSSVNEFAGFPVHRVRFLLDDPRTHPVLNGSRPLSSNELLVAWLFAADPEQEFEIDPYGMAIPDAQSSFDCNSIADFFPTEAGTKPWLLFQVEWRPAGDINSPWSILCTIHRRLVIPNLSPYAEYDVRVRAGHVRLDSYLYTIGGNFFWEEIVDVYGPRMSAGPRTPTLQLKTRPDVPGSAPLNVEIVPGRVRENSVTVRWEPPLHPNAGSITYAIRMGEADVVANNLKETVFTVDGLEPGSIHSLQVRAQSQAGQGVWSKPFQISTASRCPVGSQRMDSEGYPCKPCPFDMFRSDVSSRECTKCPADRPHTLAPGSASIEECTDGSAFLRVEINGTTREESRSVRRGFWRVSNETLDFYKCPRAEFCNPSEQKEASRWSNSDQYCSTGHTGVLCSSCLSGFALKSSGCQVCNDEESSRDRRKVIGWVIVGALVTFGPCAILLFHLFELPSSLTSFGPLFQFSCVGGFCRKRKNKKSSNGVFERFRLGIEPYQDAMREVAVALRILIGFLQVFFHFVRSIDLVLFQRNGAETAVNLDASALLQAQNVGCVWAFNFYDGLLLYTLSPLVSLVLMVFTVVAAWPYRKRYSVLGLAVWTTMQLLFLVYPGVSSKIFKTFIYEAFWKRVDDPTPLRALSSDYTIDFDSEESLKRRIYAGVMIFVYPVGVLILFCAMVRFRSSVERKTIQSEAERAVSESVAFLSRSYKWEYFECYELMRKLVLTSVFLLVQQASKGGAQVFFQGMCIVFFGVVLRTTPYKSKATDSFAAVSSFLLVVAGTIPLANRAINEMTNDMAKHLMQATFALECVAFAAILVHHLWMARPRRNKTTMPSETSQRYRQHLHPHQNTIIID